MEMTGIAFILCRSWPGSAAGQGLIAVCLYQAATRLIKASPFA
jgi:hypothetical protein